MSDKREPKQGEIWQNDQSGELVAVFNPGDDHVDVAYSNLETGHIPSNTFYELYSPTGEYHDLSPLEEKLYG